MTTIINGSSPSITFSDGTTQSTAFTTSPTLVNLSYTGTLTGGTGVVNLGSGQFYKDASGKVGIGTITPAYPLQVQSSGAVVAQFNGNNANNYIQLSDNNATNNCSFGSIAGGNWYLFTAGYGAFYTGNAERMRIDSSGNVGIGTTSVLQNSKVSVIPSINGYASQVNNDTYSNFLGNNSSSVLTFFVQGSGQINSTYTTITAISDQRLKENIFDLDEGLNSIMALKPRKFDWKPGKGKNIKGDRGFIAQEFEQVFPDMIQEWKDPAPEGEESYKAVNANLIPTLVKAIQELNAEVQALKQQLGK